MSNNQEFEKEFRLEGEDAADFLRKVADSIEEDDNIKLDGDGWKIFQPFEDIIPMRVHSDEKGFEVGFKLMNPESNTR